jgi:hypothetical protein
MSQGATGEKTHGINTIMVQITPLKIMYMTFKYNILITQIEIFTIFTGLGIFKVKNRQYDSRVHTEVSYFSDI